MAWNEPGNKGNDPWGNRGGNDQGPPDLDQVFRKLTSRFGGNRGGGGINAAAVGIAVILLALVWGLSGFYKIEEAERGVVLRFGQYYEQVGPGLGWKATFIDEVIPVNVNNIRELPASGMMLTMDENVVAVQMKVQYRITDPRAYLFNVTNPDESLNEAMDSALRYVVGHTTMDDILTTGREQVRQDTRVELEGIIEPYGLGLTVVDVNLLPARPPEEVKDAFDDAISAQEDEERFVREAEAYARAVEPEARGRVQRMEQEATAYRERVTLEAQGEVTRFVQLLPQYLAAPEVTRERLYLETMEKVFGNTSKVMVDTEGNGSMFYLPLDKIIERSGSKSAPKVGASQMSESDSQPSGTFNTNRGANNRGGSIRQGRN
ncbi:FtsH protease activity modulator HflK [Ferrimonas sediminicola]|uniref:Protein HflK n=1 Tax=Ferrimonas sediminicola TaxID=2569538 RepID=A0A4U1BJL5_9GAMM|nr:FtsH protease activity modulator HflK [Ferrimonas sediminicola]TKB51382.1 FtsH protease activity modulator HflK [Ferrimonas sediminicola]